jgi:hypothetical protein
VETAKLQVPQQRIDGVSKLHTQRSGYEGVASLNSSNLRCSSARQWHAEGYYEEVFFLFTMLTGAELLAKVKELGDVSKSELVRSCGYVSSKKDGSERLNFTAFYEALLEAKGVTLGESGTGKGPGGRKLSFVATVQGNGNLLVGKAYTAQLGLDPGDEFEIKLGKNKQIRLVPVGGADEEE